MTIKGFVTFCDDIRQEIGGKITLVGCYIGEMTVHGQAPATLAKLGLQAKLVFPAEIAPRKIDVRIDFVPGEKTLFEATLDIPEGEHKKALERVEPDGTGDEPQFVLVQNTILSPLEIPGDGRIRVRAVVDGETVKLGSLRIRFDPPAT
ncbi:MAG: DUF6941 family protein [Salinarimonas sp.]